MECVHAAEGLSARGARVLVVLDEAQAVRIVHDERQRSERCQALGEHDRARTWTTAAMGRRESLVQVDVHRIHAERARLGAHCMHRVGDIDDIALEETAGVGIGQHQGRDIGLQMRAQHGEIDTAIDGGLHFFDREAGDRSGGGIGAVRRLRDQNPRAILAAAAECRADREQATELALSAGFGDKCHGGHPGKLLEPAGKLSHDGEGALHRLLRLHRMDVRKARQARDLFVQPRIVLHGARAKRIEICVDRGIARGEPDIMADGLRFGEAGQSGRGFSDEPAEAILEGPRVW